MEPSKEESREEKLIALAKALDSECQSSLAGDTPELLDEPLNEEELDTLQRVKDALQFINAVKTNANPIFDRDFDTKTGIKDVTVGDFDRKNVAAESSQQSRYQRLEVIGEGGFAIVWLAKDLVLDRHVALKILKTASNVPGEVEVRFEREARAVAALAHPGIIPIFETGFLEDNQRYIASAWCDGDTLERWIDSQESIPFKTSAMIVADLAEAMEHAHQRGVVHRDLKPSNILIDQSGMEDSLSVTTRITDFGLAKLRNSGNENETTEGAIVGTPAYMSPEQASGTENVGPKSDIFSLGVILYELLTGRVPHGKKFPLDTLIAIRNESVRPPRQFNPKVPKDLEAICLKCIQKDPNARYSSAFMLAKDLRSWCSGEAIIARRPSTVERGLKWIRRNRLPAVAISIVSVAFLSSAWSWRTASQEGLRAQLHLANAQVTIDEMANRIASDERLPGDVRKDITQRAVELQFDLHEDEPGNLEVAKNTSLAMERLTKLLFDVAEYDEAIRVCDEREDLLSTYDTAFVEDHRFDIGRWRAGCLRRLNELAEAKLEIDALEAAKSEDGNSENFELAQVKFEQGMILLANNSYQEAIDEFKSARILFETVPSHGSALNVAQCLHFEGTGLIGIDRLPDAAEVTSASIKMLKNLVGSHAKSEIDEQLGRSFCQLGQIRSGETKMLAGREQEKAAEEARDNFQQGMAVYRKLLSRDLPNARLSPSLVVVYDLAIQMEIRLGNPDRAEKLIIELEDFFESLDHDTLAYETIGQILVSRKLDWAEMHWGGAHEPTQEVAKECLVLISKLEKNVKVNPRLGALKKRCRAIINNFK